ncbi:MAG: hypothetical protein R3E32_24730 [Chitinophagales bacterium]
MNPEIFQTIYLDEECQVYTSKSIDKFNLDSSNFFEICNLHPKDYHTIKFYGKEVLTPRWQQAYGKNYSYTGSKNNALPIPENLKIFLDW